MRKVEHIFVLMLENRSFDHMLGWLDHPKKDDLDGLKPSMSNPDNSGRQYPVTRRAGDSIEEGPGHKIKDAMEQLFGVRPDTDGTIAYPAPEDDVPTNKWFVQNYEHVAEKHGHRWAFYDPKHPTHGRYEIPGPKGRGPLVMDCQPEENLPVLATLAKKYAVCDRWFSSVPGPTWPNRMFAHMGTSEGWTSNKKRFYKSKSVFKALHEKGVSSKVYYDDVTTGWVLKDWFRHEGDNYKKGRKKLLRHIREWSPEKDHNKLPSYVFIEPDHLGGDAASQHPSYNEETGFALGEQFIYDIYKALEGNRELFERSILLITYDEHGGFYDHVRPPRAEPPGDGKEDTEHGFKFDMLGVRVPAVVISPFIEEGTIDHTVYDHTSIIRSCFENFLDEEVWLTNRDRKANSFLHLLTRDEPRTDVVSAVPRVPIKHVDFAGITARNPSDGMDLGDDYLNDNADLLVFAAKAKSIVESGRKAATDESTLDASLDALDGDALHDQLRDQVGNDPDKYESLLENCMTEMSD